jgi:hypothetical protein
VRNLVVIAAIAAVAALGVSHPGVTNSPPRGQIVTAAFDSPHPEPAICGPIVASVEHWLPIVDKATPHARIIKRYPSGAVQYALPGHPWDSATTAIYDAGQHATGKLQTSAVMAADSVNALGAGLSPSAWRPVLRQALKSIRGYCPSLPASVANGPLPR